MLRRITTSFTRWLPPKVHFVLVQPFSQTRKFFNTLLYHCYLYKLRRKEFAGLHLGSGSNRIAGFCNIDANPYSRCEVVSDIKRLKLRSESVEVIYSSHVFEHIPRAETNSVLREWYRVLKPEGKLYLCVPNLETLFTIYLRHLPRYHAEADRKLVDAACGIVYGGQADRHDFHFYGYSFATMNALLESLGFHDVQLLDSTGFCTQTADASQSTVADIPISLNLVTTK